MTACFAGGTLSLLKIAKVNYIRNELIEINNKYCIQTLLGKKKLIIQKWIKHVIKLYCFNHKNGIEIKQTMFALYLDNI